MAHHRLLPSPVRALVALLLIAAGGLAAAAPASAATAPTLFGRTAEPLPPPMAAPGEYEFVQIGVDSSYPVLEGTARNTGPTTSRPARPAP